MSERFDVAIVGGGVIGVASADLLAARGVRVVLLERGEVASGASYGNAGWISPSHGTPLPAPGVIRQALRWLFDPESPFYVKPRLDWALARWLLGFLRASTAARARETLRVNRELILASLERYAEARGTSRGSTSASRRTASSSRASRTPASPRRATSSR